MNNEMPLAVALSAKREELCIGVEDGVADIYELVTPVTAELLRWWFLGDICGARNLNFHQGQRDAILNTIVAHEVQGAESLKDLYQKVAPEVLLNGGISAIAQQKNAHPKYCLKMATGTGKTWVLQALLIWQLLNANAAKQRGEVDPRFTRNFLIVAPGLIVYERLLDAFCGKLKDGIRDFNTSDVNNCAELFIPEGYRDAVFNFVRSNVCEKQDIGLKTTGNGFIGITNWHLLAETDEMETEEEVVAPGATLPPEQIVKAVLPLTPGKATGNSLDMLDRRYARGNVLDYLSAFPDLMVFNDEAHHIHEMRADGETEEVEWQKSLSHIAANKGRRFCQVDFSATPYNSVGAGKKKKKSFFPHVIVDFDLKTAMRLGFVKSLVLDKRREIGALPLEFHALRDDKNKVIGLSEGQRVMLRAGFTKLKHLEKDFAKLDPDRHPKMMVVCEDTTVTPYVEKFFMQDAGLSDDEILTVDSGKKADLGDKEWERVRERLFDLDKHATPRIVVSVLMLREGFDVNNVCVIVPLRSSQAPILLEQLIGRGLRLMWREPEYHDIKIENRELIGKGKNPRSLIDVLSIVEHPAFQGFYDDLIKEGLVGEGIDPPPPPVGDMISVGLREGFEEYDFEIPTVIQEADESLSYEGFKPETLPPFTTLSRDELKQMLGKGDVFISQDLLAQTLFGDYRVDGAVMHVDGYNDYLTRLTRRISQLLSEDVPKGKKISAHANYPYLQIERPIIAGWLDDYIRETLFGEGFDPMEDENWRLLLLKDVLDHLVKVFSDSLLVNQERPPLGEAKVLTRKLSEIKKLMMRESHSVEVNKCIYERLPFPAHSGGLEEAFIAWADHDGSVAAFCKISETKHAFLHLRYAKEDGFQAFYSPDFLVRTTDGQIYLVETKAQAQVSSPNVQRKLKAAQTWCERINDLPEEKRGNREWHYVLLGEETFYNRRDNNDTMANMLRFAKVHGREKEEQLPLA